MFFRTDRSELINCGFLMCFQAMASVTVETVTVLPVGMETDVNSSVTSAHGKAGGDACLQMAKSAATEVCLLRPGRGPRRGIPSEPLFNFNNSINKAIYENRIKLWMPMNIIIIIVEGGYNRKNNGMTNIAFFCPFRIRPVKVTV